MNLGINSSTVQFRGTTYNENGIPYYKTNKGTVAGAIMAVPAVLINIAPLSNKTENYEADTEKFFEMMGMKVDNDIKKDIKAMKDLAERKKKLAIPFAIAAGACTLGAGVLYDKIRNKKAKNAANDIVTGNINNIYADGGEVGTSLAGIPYYKSNNGVKYGLLSGAVWGLVKGAMDSISAKKFDVGAMIGAPLAFALGGLIMGAIAQKTSNNAAEKSTYMV